MSMKVNSQKIKELRVARSWTQEDLAEKADVNVRTVQRAEATGSASRRSITSIAGALDVEVEVLSNTIQVPFSAFIILTAILWASVMLLTGITFRSSPETNEMIQDILVPAAVISLFLTSWLIRRYKKSTGIN